MVDWAKAECPGVDGRWETAQFRDHWLAASGVNATKRDWTAAWRTWMRRATAAPPGQRRRRTLDDKVADAGAMFDRMLGDALHTPPDPHLRALGG
jgi:hypothetical protein